MELDLSVQSIHSIVALDRTSNFHPSTVHTSRKRPGIHTSNLQFYLDDLTDMVPEPLNVAYKGGIAVIGLDTRLLLFRNPFLLPSFDVRATVQMCIRS
jgi:hypothetical protein